jgi:hypothetical protein
MYYYLSLASKAPFQVVLVPEELLPTSQPSSHLRIFIAVVGCTVGIFCEINMKTLCIFSVIIVCCSKQFNGVNIVNQGVKLGQVEVLTNAKLNKYVFVVMEIMKGLVEELEGFRGMDRVLGKV